jgi:hypothetical protein
VHSGCLVDVGEHRNRLCVTFSARDVAVRASHGAAVGGRRRDEVARAANWRADSDFVTPRTRVSVLTRTSAAPNRHHPTPPIRSPKAPLLLVVTWLLVAMLYRRSDHDQLLRPVAIKVPPRIRRHSNPARENMGHTTGVRPQGGTLRVPGADGSSPAETAYYRRASAASNRSTTPAAEEWLAVTPLVVGQRPRQRSSMPGIRDEV